MATIWRILKRKGLVTPRPHKRPRASFIRFEAKFPNETWQVDATPWQLADGTPVEILNWLDDRSRLAVASSCFPSVRPVTWREASVQPPRGWDCEPREKVVVSRHRISWRFNVERAKAGAR